MRRLVQLALLPAVPLLLACPLFDNSTEPNVPPDAPTIGAAVAGDASAEISFTAPANSGTAAITEYTVTCAAAGAAARTGTGPTSPITVSNLTNGTTYSCTVTATSSAGTSDASGSVAVTPATVPDAPTIGTVSPGDGSASVAFTPPASNGGAAITGYTATCTASGASATGTGATSPVTVSGLTNGTQYACSVIATNARGNSPASASANVTPASTPGAPTIGTATAGDGQASIAFTAPSSDGGSPITTYAAVCTASGQTTADANGSSSPITVTGMTNGIQYACNVRAANEVGAGPASSNVNVTPQGPPGVPTSVTATPGNASASIAFAVPASDGGSPIKLYTALCTASNHAGVTATNTTSPISVTGLVNGVQWSCAVKATNEIVGDGSYSTAATVTPRTVPGAPTIGVATPGNASISLTFTAPASNGGAAITSYAGSCATATGTIHTVNGTASPIAFTSLTNDVQYACAVSAINEAGQGPSSDSARATPTAPPSTSSVWCPLNYDQVNAVSLLQSKVSWTCTATTRSMTSTQIPDYPAAISYANNPNSMGVQNDPAVTFTLTPSLSGSTYSNNVHIIGWAKNGVKFEPSTAEVCPTRSYCQKPGATFGTGTTWNVEALGQTLFSAGVDNANGHNQPGPNNSTTGGAYHYHGMPNKYLSWLSSGNDTSATPAVQHYLIGFALDGFPIYAKYGYSDALDANSAIREITSSYRLKASPDAGRPSVDVIAMGTFTQDWEYVEGHGDLDQCNGRFGKTPEFPNGIYHYYITNGFPYIQRCFKGVYP